MPAPSSALPFAAKAPSPIAPPANAAPANDGPSPAAKPAFEDMVRRPVKRDDAAPRKPAAQASEGHETVRRQPDGAVRTPDDATRASPDEDAPQDADTAPLALLALLDAPAPPPAPNVPTPDAGTAVPTDPPGNPLPGGAMPTATAPAPDALLAGARAAMPAVLPGALPATAAATGGTPATSAAEQADATGTPATTLPTATDAAARAPLQNLLSFATHLATGQVAAALPDALNLGRDIVDALRSDDGEAPAPTGNVLAGIGASHGALGLSRTDTVNATEAPGADLHGGHFDEDVGDAVRWMADQKIGHAHIKVTPNELGTVEIRLRLEGDRVHADFASTQAEVRQALESSLPRLREMLGQHGFQLAHADVGHQHAPPSQHASPRDGEGPAAGTEAPADAPRTVRMTALGLLDAYA